jgi:serine/threonine protein kinase
MNAPNPAPPLRPIDNLVGTTLANNWTIVSKLPAPGTAGAEDLTGSFFSVGYIAATGSKEKGTYREAFLKIIDVSMALEPSPLWDPRMGFIERLKSITDSHSFECTILEVCEKANLDRIVRILLKGDLPPPTGMFMPVPYILFELADGDVRKVVSRTNRVDDAWRLHVLHDVAVGLLQLHGQEIAHQDLKPSNVLIFDDAGKGAKIGDLGRASKRGTAAAHDGAEVAGALLYAPPEQIFGLVPPRWEDRREGCDLYHLGTLVCFLFSGMTPTAHYLRTIDDAIRPGRWDGQGRCDYATALPLLTTAFTEFVATIRKDFPTWAADELTDAVMHACHPDYNRRGDPASRARTGSPIGIDTFASRFNRLAKRAEIEIRR